MLKYIPCRMILRIVIYYYYLKVLKGLLADTFQALLNVFSAIPGNENNGNLVIRPVYGRRLSNSQVFRMPSRSGVLGRNPNSP